MMCHKVQSALVDSALEFCAFPSDESSSPSSGSDLEKEQQQWARLHVHVILYVLRVVLQTGDELFHRFALKADLVYGCKQRKLVDHVPLLKDLVDLR